MKVLYTGCPRCNGDICVGAEYEQDGDTECHCPACALEFPFREGVDRPLRWSLSTDVAS